MRKMIGLGVALVLAQAAMVQPPRTPARPDQNLQTPVTEPFSDPVFESVCHLWIRRRAVLVFTPQYSGSAVLYRGRYLLTAGHNVYQDRSSIRSVDVRCGNASATEAVVDERIEEWQALGASGYDGNPFSRDFGVVRLNRQINVSRPFELATTPVRVGDLIRFAGYPGGPHGGWSLFEARGAVQRVRDGIVNYDILTFKSNSGGHVWRDVDGRPELVAIHVMPSGGRIVDADYIQEIERLIAELDARAAARGLSAGVLQRRHGTSVHPSRSAQGEPAGRSSGGPGIW